ncbi:MAG: hypothetical protein P1P88_12525 [Bacteroidales bacterium]|nr:hypothetical protein [Bacteroidales bacterium]
MVPILETDYATLTLDQERDVLKLVWKMDCTSETYRFIYENVLDLFNKTKIKFYVADIRKLVMVAPSDRIWLQEDVIPKLFDMGLLKIAAIVDGDVYIQRHIAHINKAIEDAKPIKQFGNLDEALKWFAG